MSSFAKPVMIGGALGPGCGKTTVVRRICREHCTAAAIDMLMTLTAR